MIKWRGSPSRAFNFSILIFIISMLNLFTSPALGDTVPALIWNSQKKTSHLPSGTLQKVLLQNFENDYVKNFASKNVLIFMQDQLSIEDFSGHPEVWDSFSGALDCTSLTYIPSLENGAESFESVFKSSQYKERRFNVSSFQDGLNLNENVKNLIVFELPAAQSASVHHETLKKSVDVMKNVLSSLKDQDFTIILTGREPSVDVGQRLRIARSLKQSPSPNDPSFHHSDCINMYLRTDVLVQLSDGNSYKLPSQNSLDGVSDCQKNVNSMLIIYKDLPQHPKVNLKFNFGRRPGGWALDNMEISEMVNGKMQTNIRLNPMWKMDPVPLGKSYSCGDTWILRSDSAATGSPTYTVTVRGIQVEAFTNGQVTFSTAFDCVGFFTIPILTGLLTAVLLTVILLVGMHMLSEIKTMDRFDDPKGKHIVPHTTSE